MWFHTGLIHSRKNVSCLLCCVLFEELRSPEASVVVRIGSSGGPAGRSPCLGQGMLLTRPGHSLPFPLQPNKVLHEPKELRLLCAEDEQSRTCWMTAFRLLKVAGRSFRGGGCWASPPFPGGSGASHGGFVGGRSEPVADLASVDTWGQRGPCALWDT